MNAVLQSCKLIDDGLDPYLNVITRARGRLEVGPARRIPVSAIRKAILVFAFYANERPRWFFKVHERELAWDEEALIGGVQECYDALRTELLDAPPEKRRYLNRELQRLKEAVVEGGIAFPRLGGEGPVRFVPLRRQIGEWLEAQPTRAELLALRARRVRLRERATATESRWIPLALGTLFLGAVLGGMAREIELRR